MADPQVILDAAIRRAIAESVGVDADAIVRPATNPQFGDYQANFAMPLAKELGRSPRDLAEAVVAELDLGAICERVEVAGPGFVNLTLDRGWIAATVGLLVADDRLGVETDAQPERVVVDYSHPNVAKEMHVGHLRSTIIGDALCRVLGWLGHSVIRQNHIGDWGTPYGMLIEHLLDIGEEEAAHELSVGDLTGFYQQARVKFDTDPTFADRARHRVVLLQAGDEETMRSWRLLVHESNVYFDEVYERLGVLLTDDDLAGESTYNDMLPVVAAELTEMGLAVIDHGALCVFPEGFTGRDGNPQPLIVRKSDGGFGYAATDLAALRYRTRTLGATRVVYVVGAPQAQHLAMVFAVGRMAGWLEKGRAEHVAFGSVLGADGRVLKTRAGDSPKLIDLLDEAVARAAAAVADKNPDLDESARADVAQAVGIGAVKYADLSTDRIKDYRFDWDRMLAFEGNTAAYLQYAYVRVRSIFRRGEVSELGTRHAGAILVEAPEERALALTLLRFDAAVQAVAQTLEPHRLCTYLFELAQAYTAFFEACPVLRADTPELRLSRLVLCELTARVLSTGLGLLGIQTVEQM
jgi:arginyl-tRNA synthetase